jgi:hypothetical protein
LYQYVYSLGSGEWAKEYNVISYKSIINNYPGTILQALNKRTSNDGVGGDLYDLSRNYDDDDFAMQINGLAVSRPLSFGEKNILKTINRIENRGFWNEKWDSFIFIALYGSRDLQNWYKLKSLRGFSWKYFRIVYYSRLNYKEALTGSSFVIDSRWNNKIR